MSENQHVYGAKGLLPSARERMAGDAPVRYRLQRGLVQTRHTHDLIVRLDGTANDMTDSQGIWDEKCVDKEDGYDTVMSYSAPPDPGPGT